MKKGMISIILPVYKVEEYIDRCLESLVDQTYKNLEIILVDDGSPDGSGKKCDEWAKKDKRIKVFHKENGGVSSARNLGLEKATGEYIGFVDPDDFLDITMYEKLYNKARDTNADITMCGFSYYYDDGRILPIDEINLINIDHKNFIDFAINTNSKLCDNKSITSNIMGGIWRTLFNKKFIGKIRFRNLKIREDLMFYFDLLNKSPKFAIVKESLYYYYIRESSAMRNINKIALDYRLEFVNVLEELAKENSIDFRGYKFHIFKECAILAATSQDKNLYKYISCDARFKNLNSKENYVVKQKQTKGFKSKLINFLMHHKMFVIYRMLRKIAGK